jgi:dihydroorotate dehydrogenase (fumarate)
MTDLSTTYLGLNLKNPLVVSASPFSKNLDKARKMEEVGASAIVMHSLFEEQIIHESLELDHYLTQGTDSFAEAMSYFPDSGAYLLAPEKYLHQVTELKKALKIPVIGSLNGVSKGGWTNYAKQIQDAGADALELNLYYIPTALDLTCQELEDAQVELVSEVKSAINIPLAVKLSPFITALPNFACRVVDAGANGLVLFNRFYQPDFDLEEMKIIPSLDLSAPADMRLPLRWISILYSKVNTDFALTSGLHSATDMIKAMMAGAKVGMMASALLQDGEQIIPSMLTELEGWMKQREYASIKQMQGSMSQKSVKEPAAFERANYMNVLNSFRDTP